MPVYVYSHNGGACSVTGGYVYRGRAVPASVGRYYFGDYCSGAIWSLKMVNGTATGVRREPATIGNLATFGLDSSRELYAGTGDGRIFSCAR